MAIAYLKQRRVPILKTVLSLAGVSEIVLSRGRSLEHIPGHLNVIDQDSGDWMLNKQVFNTVQRGIRHIYSGSVCIFQKYITEGVLQLETSIQWRQQMMF